LGVIGGVRIGSLGCVAAELPSERVELLLCLLELELELRCINSLRLGDEDAAFEQLELLHQLSIRPTQVIALAGDARDLAGCRSKLFGCRGELALHATHESLELLLARRRRL
jgi:hypothetical protein